MTSIDLNQQSLARYWQQTVALAPSTDVSFGARLQRNPSDRRVISTIRPRPAAFGAQATPLDTTETNHALHFGVEHRFSPGFAVFGRVARSFRTPNVDERIGVNAFPVELQSENADLVRR